MRETHPEMSHGRRALLACAAVVAALAMSGCGGMMQTLKEELTDEKVEFNALYTMTADARSKAEVTKQGMRELERADYIRLGELSVKYINERCFPNEKCSAESHSDLPTARLLSEAASRGADVVVLSEDNHKDSGQAVKNGRCLMTKSVAVPRQVCDYETNCNKWGCTTRQRWCRTEYTWQEQCAKWEQIYGTESFTRSRASIWRKDPELVAQVRFGDDFFRAIETGQMAQVKALTAKGMRVEVQDLRGRYPILKAAEANQTEVGRFLLEKGAKPDVDNSRALVTASEKNNASLVALMLEHGADPNAKIGLWAAMKKDSKPEEGKPLINAAAKNNLAMARVLLKHKANPDAMDGSPLKYAISNGNRDMINLLLDNGASVRENGVLTSTVQKNDMQLLALFLDKGADPDNRDWSGLTPLQAAAGGGRVDMMRVLLDKGADVDKRGLGGDKTPLMHAVQAGQVEAVRVLLEHKADVTVKDLPTGIGWMGSLMGMPGKTALVMARSGAQQASQGERKRAYQEIMNLLVAAGAKE